MEGGAARYRLEPISPGEMVRSVVKDFEAQSLPIPVTVAGREADRVVGRGIEAGNLGTGKLPAPEPGRILKHRICETRSTCVGVFWNMGILELRSPIYGEIAASVLVTSGRSRDIPLVVREEGYTGSLEIVSHPAKRHNCGRKGSRQP